MFPVRRVSMDLMNGSALSPMRLRFRGELEEMFREDYYYKSLGQLRIAIALGTALYALFGILDAVIFPEMKSQTLLLRLMIVCPLCLLTLLFSYSRHFKPYMQVAVFLAVFVSGAGIVALMVIVRSPINYFHFAGLLLVLMFSFAFSKLRFFYATLVAWAIVGVYEVAALAIMHTTLQVFLNDNFFYVSANLIGMFACYHRELYMRKDFLQNIMVKELEEKNHLMEKEKILRELHDGIGGIATNISLLADLAQKAETLEDAKKMLATIQDLTREELTEIRNYMRSLDAREMTWQQLSAELRSQGRTVIEPHGIGFDIASSVAGAPGSPGSLLWLNLFRIYKESLTNVIKHAQARAVQVELHVVRERLVLTVSDDGLGGRSAPGTGRGMYNMSTRAEELGGSLTVSSGSGMSVRLAVPLPVRYAAQKPGEQAVGGLL